MIISPGTTSVIKQVFLQDSSVATGAGKTALAFGDITAYYVRAGGALTALTLVDITTLGTWDTDVTDDKLGFKKLHDTNAPGLYEIHLPNNILAAGANQVTIQLRATGTAPCNIEIQLLNAPAVVKAQDNIDFGALQKASLNAATPASVQNIPATGTGFTALGDARLANLDATVSSRSTLTAQQVWEYATRTLSSFGTLVADAAAVWGVATRALTDKAGFSISGTKTTLDALQDLTSVQAQAASAAALAAYDPPTRAEATADKAEVAALVEKVRKAVSNRLVVDPDTGAFTIYDDNGTTPLITGTISGTGRSIPTWA